MATTLKRKPVHKKEHKILKKQRRELKVNAALGKFLHHYLILYLFDPQHVGKNTERILQVEVKQIEKNQLKQHHLKIFFQISPDWRLGILESDCFSLIYCSPKNELHGEKKITISLNGNVFVHFLGVRLMKSFNDVHCLEDLDHLIDQVSKMKICAGIPLSYEAAIHELDEVIFQTEWFTPVKKNKKINYNYVFRHKSCLLAMNDPISM